MTAQQMYNVCVKRVDGLSNSSFILLFFILLYYFENENEDQSKAVIVFYFLERIVAISNDPCVVVVVVGYALLKYAYLHTYTFLCSFFFLRKMTNWISVHPFYVPFVFVQSSFFAYKPKNIDTTCNQRELYPAIKRNK